MAIASREPIAGFDIVRFAAAALVTIFHLGTETWAAPGTVAAKIVDGRAAFPELFSVTWSGFIGVEIFFVISGFVITYSATDAQSFLRSRIMRLYPAVWICATASVVAVWAFHLESPRHLLHSYANSMFLIPVAPWVDAAYWTLGIEMAFYAVIFFLLAAKAFHRIGIVCYLIGGASAAYWLLGSMLAPSFLSSHLWNRWVELSLISYGIYFALGILLHSARKSGFSLPLVGFGLVLLIAAGVEISYKVEYAPNALIFPYALTKAVPITLFFVAVVAMVVSLGWKVSTPTARALRVLGLMTYPLYLIHNNFGAALLRLLVDLDLNQFAALSVVVSLCLVFSFFVATVLEPPIRRFVKAVFDRAVELGARSPMWHLSHGRWFPVRGDHQQR